MSEIKSMREMSPEEFAKEFDDFLNRGMKGYTAGLTIGQELRNTHRTLQRSAIVFCVGLISGLSEQEYTDARNEQAIEAAKQIAEMYRTGELNFGLFI